MSAKYEWVCMNDKAAFAPRDGAGLLAYKGKMWLLGGWNPGDKVNFPKICNSEVWSSTDGKDWKLELKQAPWEGRHCAGYVVFKDKMWIVGGDCNQGHYQNDMWCSTDGVKWDCVTDKVPWGPRVLQYAVVHRNKIWVMGGQVLPSFAPWPEEIFYDDVWNSDDGKNWTKVLDHAPWAPRGMIGGGAVHKDRIWIIGGGTYDTPKKPDRIFYNDVWSSADGIVWDHVAKSTPWDKRQYHEIAVFDNRFFVMEGYVKARGNTKDVWHSADGINWEEMPNTPWLPRHAGSVCVHDNALWMVAGNNMTSDSWKLVKKG